MRVRRQLSWTNARGPENLPFFRALGHTLVHNPPRRLSSSARSSSFSSADA